MSYLGELEDQIAYFARRLSYTGYNKGLIALKAAAPGEIAKLQAKIAAYMNQPTPETQQQTITIIPTTETVYTTQLAIPPTPTPEVFATTTATSLNTTHLLLLGVGLYLLTGGKF